MIGDQILGVDPGLAACGWAVVAQTAQRILLVECGTIRTSPTASIEARVGAIAHDLEAACDHATTGSAAESLEVRRQRGETINPASLIGPAMVLGALVATLDRVRLVRASEWRKAIGAGHGTPAEVRAAVERVVGPVKGSVHAVDAVGIALWGLTP